MANVEAVDPAAVQAAAAARVAARTQLWKLAAIVLLPIATLIFSYATYSRVVTPLSDARFTTWTFVTLATAKVGPQKCGTEATPAKSPTEAQALACDLERRSDFALKSVALQVAALIVIFVMAARICIASGGVPPILGVAGPFGVAALFAIAGLAFGAYVNADLDPGTGLILDLLAKAATAKLAAADAADVALWTMRVNVTLGYVAIGVLLAALVTVAVKPKDDADRVSLFQLVLFFGAALFILSRETDKATLNWALSFLDGTVNPLSKLADFWGATGALFLVSAVGGAYVVMTSERIDPATGEVDQRAADQGSLKIWQWAISLLVGLSPALWTAVSNTLYALPQN